MKHKINNEREAIEQLIRNGIDADSDDKVVLYSSRTPGLRLMAAFDYLINRCNYRQLGQVATESYLKAKAIASKRKASQL